MEFYAIWDNMTDQWDRPWAELGPALYPNEEMANRKIGQRTHGKRYIKRHKNYWLFLSKPDADTIVWYEIRKVRLVIDEDC